MFTATRDIDLKQISYHCDMKRPIIITLESDDIPPVRWPQCAGILGSIAWTRDIHDASLVFYFMGGMKLEVPEEAKFSIYWG